MILSEAEVTERIESPMNLLNRLKTSLSARSSRPFIPSVPKSAELVENLDEKLENVGLKSKAARIMGKALKKLEDNIDEIDKPKELASIAETMNKITTAKVEDKKINENGPQIILHAPMFFQENHFETITVRE